MPKLRPLAWNDVRNGVLDVTSAVTHDEQAATNDASTGVQVPLPPHSSFFAQPSARAREPQPKAVAYGHNHERALDALFRRPVLGSQCRCVPTAAPHSRSRLIPSEAVSGLASLTALLRSAKRGYSFAGNERAGSAGLGSPFTARGFRWPPHQMIESSSAIPATASTQHRI